MSFFQNYLRWNKVQSPFVQFSSPSLRNSTISGTSLRLWMLNTKIQSAWSRYTFPTFSFGKNSFPFLKLIFRLYPQNNGSPGCTITKKNYKTWLSTVPSSKTLSEKVEFTNAFISQKSQWLLRNTNKKHQSSIRSQTEKVLNKSNQW